MNRRNQPRWRWLPVCLVLAVLGVSSCAPCGFYLDGVRVLGEVVDAETGEPLEGLVFAGRTFTDGVETEMMVGFTRFGTPNGPPSDESGGFKLSFHFAIGGPPGPCEFPSLPREFPRPDQLEITVIVERGVCEQVFLIDINEDSVEEIPTTGTSDLVLELKNPILVAACPE